MIHLKDTERMTSSVDLDLTALNLNWVCTVCSDITSVPVSQKLKALKLKVIEVEHSISSSVCLM